MWYIYAWGNNPVRAKYKGWACRVLVRSTRLGSVLVEFGDGFRMVTAAKALKAESMGGDWYRIPVST